MTEQIGYRRTIDQIGFARVCHLITLDTELSDGAVRLYMLLLKYAQDKSACWPGVERLARELNKSQRTIKRYLAALEKRGLITREQRGRGQTAKTWIEDLEAVYGQAVPSMALHPVDNSSSDTDGTASSDKNGTAQAVTNLSPKEEQEEEQTDAADGWTTMQRQSLTILKENGADVTRTVLSVARRRSPDDVRGMIDAARHKPGLSNPIGWAIARLRDGASPPQLDDADDGDDRIAATCPVCYRVMPLELICENCGRCVDCCEC